MPKFFYTVIAGFLVLWVISSSFFSNVYPETNVIIWVGFFLVYCLATLVISIVTFSLKIPATKELSEEEQRRTYRKHLKLASRITVAILVLLIIRILLLS